VVFAPTPLPPDLSPLRYQHPGGAFSLVLPRTWVVYEQNTTTLASASFAPPGDDDPLIEAAVVNLGKPVDTDAFATLINEYQTRLRPDAAHYKEQDRQAMGDGSWRLTGLRETVGSATQQVNTFIERAGSLIGVLDVVVPDDPQRFADLQTIVNSFRLNQEATLQTADLNTLSYATRTSLDVLHVSTWTTPTGVFFITGEVANLGGAPLSDVPVRAVLSTADGRAIAEAVDSVMGYTLPPGGFAPFSLRFGQGQPALTTNYILYLGNEQWKPDQSKPFLGADQMTWTDTSALTPQGQLAISGSVTNTSSQTAHSLRAVVTVFNVDQNVIAAGFADVGPELAAGASTPFQILVPELGGVPTNYIVNIEALP
jgi:hypothetical protein